MDEITDLENLKKLLSEFLESADQLMGGANCFNHITWMLVVNTGALLWFVGILDKFTYNNQLVSKWWVILTIVCLLFPLVTLYRIRVVLIKLNLELKKIKAECSKTEGLNKINLDKFLAIAKMLPSTIASNSTDFLFLIGIISMVSYIITYFIRFK